MESKASYTYTNSNRIQQSSNVTGLMLGLLRTAPDFDIEHYKGSYIYGDYCSGKIWALDYYKNKLPTTKLLVNTSLKISSFLYNKLTSPYE